MSQAELAPFLNEKGELSVDDLATFTKVPYGNYTAKLADIQVTEPKTNADGSTRNPQLEATYEVLEGAQRGRTVKTWYSLDVKPPTEPGGKVSARGIADIVGAIKNVGGDIKSVPFSKPMEMRKLVAQHLGKKNLDIAFLGREGTGKYAGKTYENLKVLGIAKGKATREADLDASPGTSDTAATGDDLV